MFVIISKRNSAEIRKQQSEIEQLQVISEDYQNIHLFAQSMTQHQDNITWKNENLQQHIKLYINSFFLSVIF